LKRGGDSIIVNISSVSAATGHGSSIAYCASKAAVDTMGLSLARALGPEIRVISISPAAVATDFVPVRGRAGVVELVVVARDVHHHATADFELEVAIREFRRRLERRLQFGVRGRRSADGGDRCDQRATKDEIVPHHTPHEILSQPELQAPQPLRPSQPRLTGGRDVPLKVLRQFYNNRPTRG
jgi:hypothetical protein